MGRPKSDNPRVFYGVRLPTDTIRRIDELADKFCVPGHRPSPAQAIIRAVFDAHAAAFPNVTVSGSNGAPTSANISPVPSDAIKRDGSAYPVAPVQTKAQRIAELNALARAAEQPRPLAAVRIGRVPLLKPGRRTL